MTLSRCQTCNLQVRHPDEETRLAFEENHYRTTHDRAHRQHLARTA